MENLAQRVWEVLTVYGLRILAAIAVFIIGRLVVKGLTRAVERLLERSKIDETLVKFTSSLTYVALLTFVILAAIGQLGIQTTSFIAVLGAAGLAVG